MKDKFSKLTIVCGLVLAAAVAMLAAVAPQPPANLHEFTVLVNPTNWLSANKVRFLPRLEINPTNGGPVALASVEAWGDDVQDNGTTNQSVIQRKTFVLTGTQVANWAAAPNGFAWLSNAILAKTKLTPKP
jgi:hypothetical protein